MARPPAYLLSGALAAALLLSSLAPARAAGTWGPLGSGLTGVSVEYLHVWDGKLIAAGLFTSAGGAPAHNIAAWDGSQWTTLGEGWDSIRGITTYNGQLAVAGFRPDSTVQEIALWDGAAWTMFAESSPVRRHLANFNGELYHADWWEDVLGYEHAEVRKYDGSNWVTVRTWVRSPGTHAKISLLTVIDDSLFVDVGDPGWIYAYDGSSWTPKGTTGREVGRAMLKVNGTLYSMGLWTVGDPGVSFWDGTSWNDILALDYFTPDYFGSTGRGLIEFDGKVTIGATFYEVPKLHRVIQWEGSSWSTLGGEMNANVRTLAIYNGKLIAAGEFTEADGVPAGMIAEYLGPATPVAISGLDVRRHAEGVELSWQIVADELFDGFHIYRSEAGSSQVRVTSSLLPAGARRFLDRTAVPGNRYGYVLVALGTEGGEVRSRPAEIELAPLVAELYQNSPNPFNPSTTIRFVVPASGRVTIDVFGPSGVRVRTLVSATYAPGEWSTSWDGTDEKGNPVASGVYYYRMRIGSVTQAKKMVLLK